MIKKLVVLLGVFNLIVAFFPIYAPSASQETNKEKEEIINTLHKMEEAFNSKAHEKYISYFAPGSDNTNQLYADSNLFKGTVKFNEIEVIHINKNNIALVKFNSSHKTSSGIDKDTGVFQMVKTDSGWKIADSLSITVK